MILIRTALIKLMQTCAIVAVSICILASFLLTYSYISGDRQDRAEMVATAERAADLFNSKPHGHTHSASLASEN